MSLADDLTATVFNPPTRAELIAHLEAEGGVVTFDRPTERVVNLGGAETGRVRFAVCSDTHLGHRHQQLTHLKDFYRRAGDFGAEFMLHAGDLVDGQNMHRDQQFELFKHGVDAQAKYAIENLPRLYRSGRIKRKGGTTVSLPQYIIGGNHDGSGWNDVGANVLGQLADNRPDVTFLGAPAATFIHGPLRIYLMHPDGGVSYARSYKLQKIVEGFEADAKPHILLCGHWHVQCHVSVRNVEAFALPCFQSQTAYIKRKGLFPVIGGYLFDVTYNELGPVTISPTFVRYSSPIAEDY